MTAEMEKSDLVSLTIDGVEVSVPAGTLVIRAAEQAGIQIPRFCDHPLLAPVGACRQCLVDVPDAGNGRGFPKPQASCTIPVAEGMVVSTVNETAAKAQTGIMEFLLINHPLDCPVCDKGGECPLQNQAMSNGRGESRFAATGGVKRTFPKPIHLSPNVLLDRERCIVCQRCTRFSDEIAGDPFIALVERGAQQQIGIAENAPFLSYFSGNTIQICPVGALTSEEYRFRARPFDLVSTPGVTEHDASGAAIRVDHRRGKVVRRLAGDDPEVNEEWITDKDRFGFAYLYADDRITYPRIREDGELRPASWLEAFEVAARGLARCSGGAGGVGVLPGGRLTLEDARAYAAFARESLGTEDVDFRSRPLSAEEAAFLERHVKGTGPGDQGAVTYADLETAPVVVLAGLEPEDEAGTVFLRLRKSVRAGGTRVIALSPFTTRGLAKLSATVVPTAPGDEADALSSLLGHADHGIDHRAVILVGERLATAPGAYAAAADLAAKSGARLAWVPRRAGDRGAVEAGLLPAAGGRDADAIVGAVLSGELAGLVVGGVDPDDTSDPAAFHAALEAAEFVVSLELRETDVTRVADVVLPVAPITDRAGTFVNWEGRERPFPQTFRNPASFTDARILAGIGEELERIVAEPASAAHEEDVAAARLRRMVLAAQRHGTAAGFVTGAGAPSSTSEGAHVAGGVHAATTDTDSDGRGASTSERIETTATFKLATWKLLLDNGVMQQGDKALAATARPPVAILSPASFARLGAMVTVTGDRGSVTVPAGSAVDLPDDVVWLPANSTGRGLLADVASPGSRVEVTNA
ncbi:NADH-quinone oxidoreductase subunit G [Nocardioides terrae]|uniref:NADH-quinone oxidoreductase n=1 Tax=Nocardioides terrae TaxID=574651 RepID=A0A1I1HLZ9_9ACTN|nr:NADH-quinone oxidoreductase subunit G [Nocardioides terrae]SFC22473.1 NADH-quinone oxidoreductase subunit G [Nocardioides terrae]